MYISYKKSYLSDGTKVKITHELFNQFKRWEISCVHIVDSYKDELKIQDNRWLNSYIGYYKKFTSLGLFEDTDSVELITESNKFDLRIIKDVLRKCTKLQRERFIKHFVLGYDCSEISNQEGKSQRTVQYSIEQIRSQIIVALENRIL